MLIWPTAMVATDDEPAVKQSRSLMSWRSTRTGGAAMPRQRREGDHRAAARWATIERAQRCGGMVFGSRARRCAGEQLSAEGELGLAIAVGEEAVVTDAVEAIWQGVKVG
jgi:hypothetical protein